MKIPLEPKAAGAVTFQSYDAQPEIAGVVYQPLRKHRDLEGWFMEYLRLAGGALERAPVKFDVRQVSFAKATPGRVNAFHLHAKEVQDELWCVLEGALLVWLVDQRAGSSSLGVKHRCVLNGEEPGLLYIPSGVAHGYKAGPDGALLVYTMNSQFNPQDPNEGRLPWDYFGKELWEEERG